MDNLEQLVKENSHEKKEDYAMGRETSRSIIYMSDALKELRKKVNLEELKNKPSQVEQKITESK